MSAQSTYSCMDKDLDSFNWSDLNSTSITIGSNVNNAMALLQDNTCGSRLRKVKMYIHLKMGDDYIHSNLNWDLTFDLKVRVQQGGQDFFSESQQLHIGQYQPEQLWVVEYPNICYFYFSDHIQYEISNLTSAGLISTLQNTLSMEVYYEFEEVFDVRDIVVTLDQFPSLVNSNPVEFKWSSSCDCTPNYEFQLLKLESMDPNPPAGNIIAEIDWSHALTIETQSSSPSIRLTVSEGSGYYLWRVRAIGDYYPGSYANSQNWGEWSDQNIWAFAQSHPQPLPIDITTPVPYLFQYQQFDEDLNWIYSRQFSEAERKLNGKIKVSEEMTYANGLQQVRQHQRHLFSHGSIVANHTGLDFSGRPALSSIYAPIQNQNHLGYVPDMAKQNGVQYSSIHFDDDLTSIDPNEFTGGRIIDYYDNGSDLSIPSSEGFAYTRTLFYGDGMNRVKQSSGVGHPLRITSDNTEDHTTKYYYSGVSSTELIRIFADEAPIDTSVIKMITVDPNRTTTVSYQTKDGQTIATCLSASDNQMHHDPLDSRNSFMVRDTISGNVSCGDHCLLSSKTVAFSEPTSVTIDYLIDPAMIDSLCGMQCMTCDYKINFAIKRVDNPYDVQFPKLDSLILPPDICTNPIDTFWQKTYPLGPGTFLIERRIQVNNVNPSSIDPITSPSGDTYLSQALDSIASYIDTTIHYDALWTTITDYLDAGETEDLYNYLETNHGLDPQATFFNFSSACCSFELPIIRCPDCPIEARDYEAYFDEIYPANSSVVSDDPNTTSLEYLLGYNTGQFNDMLHYMIDVVGYNEQDICDCWVNAVQNWESIATTSANLNGLPLAMPDLKTVFLNCTGYRWANPPFSQVAHTGNGADPKGFLSHAYGYYEYDPVNPSKCEEIYINDGKATQIPGTNPPQIDWTAVNWSSAKWDSFYLCTLHIFSGNIDHVSDAIGDISAVIQDSCLSQCEDRFDSYVASLIYHYEQELNILVDTCAGCIPMSEIYCQANNLVAHCQDMCSPLDTIFDNGVMTGIDTTGIVDIIKAMYYAFDVEVLTGGSCPAGYESVPSPGTPGQMTPAQYAMMLIDYLNQVYQTELAASIIPIQGTIDLTYYLDLFDPQIADDCFGGSLVVPWDSIGFFHMERCEIRFHSKGQQSPSGSASVRVTTCNLCQYPPKSCSKVCIRYFPIEIDTVDHVFEPYTCEEQT